MHWWSPIHHPSIIVWCFSTIWSVHHWAAQGDKEFKDPMDPWKLLRKTIYEHQGALTKGWLQLRNREVEFVFFKSHVGHLDEALDNYDLGE